MIEFKTLIPLEDDDLPLLKEKLYLEIDHLSHDLELLNNKDGGSIKINIKNKSLASDLQEIINDFCLARKKIKKNNTLYQSKFKPIFHKDPHDLLFQTGDLIKISDGEFAIKGSLLRLIEFLDQKLKKLCQTINCIEHYYPVFLESSPLLKLNYFETMGQHIFVPLSPKGERRNIESFNFSNSKSNNHQNHLNLDLEDMCDATKVLAPSVCFHCFSSLKNKNLAFNQAITAKNRCFRNERSAMQNLKRLQTFTMREAVFIGQLDWVEEGFETIKNTTLRFLESLNLFFKLSEANDYFFGKKGANAQIFQSSHKLKYEFQAYLPYDNSHISVGSINKHVQSMGQSFEIMTSDGNPSYSCCMGIGLERLALALLAQQGETVLNENHPIYSS